MEPDRFIEGLARLGSDQWAAIVARHYDLSRRPEVEDARMACREVASSAGRLLAWKRAGDRAWAAAPGAGAITQAVPRKSADLE
ncbi:MAG: hypothetical protein ACREPA_08670, partial [Candidatus Dormibacteraceae bacterium]